MGSRDFTPAERRAIQRELSRQLGPEFISYRPHSGAKVAYLESWQAISLANSTFGFDGWNSSVKSLTVDYCELTPQNKYNVGITAIVRVELKNGSYHEDVGFGVCEGQKSKAQSLEKAKKEAVTDAMKRCFRLYGPCLGGCIYDKTYLNRVGRVKAEPVPFDETQLRREGQAGDGLPLSAAEEFALAQQHRQQQQQQQPYAPHGGQAQGFEDPDSAAIINDELLLELDDPSNDDFAMDTRNGPVQQAAVTAATVAAAPTSAAAAHISNNITTTTTNVVVNIGNTISPNGSRNARQGSGSGSGGGSNGRHAPYTRPVQHSQQQQPLPRSSSRGPQPPPMPPQQSHNSSDRPSGGGSGYVPGPGGAVAAGAPTSQFTTTAQPPAMASSLASGSAPRQFANAPQPAQFQRLSSQQHQQQRSPTGVVLGAGGAAANAASTTPFLQHHQAQGSRRSPLQDLPQAANVTVPMPATTVTMIEASMVENEMESLSGSQCASLFDDLDERDVAGLHITGANGGAGFA